MIGSIEFATPPESDLVSCIVPVYNGERYLAETIDAVLDQSYAPIEIIVVDDGSTDGTPAIVREYAERVRSIRQENAGPSAARNRGLEAARGEFIAFCDADDLWMPHKTAVQIDAMLAHEELAYCLGEMESFFVSEVGERAKELARHPYHARRPAFSPCTLLARRGVFARLGAFDTGLRAGEDTEWFMRTFKAGERYRVLPELVVRRRIHPASLTARNPPDREALLQVLRLALHRSDR